MSGAATAAVLLGAWLDGALKLTVPLGLAAVVTPAIRSPSARHAVWAGALLTAPALPLLAACRGADIAWDGPLLLGVLVAGAVASVVPWLAGVAALRGITARATRLDDGLLVSREVGSPLTWRARTPVIVLPDAAATWPATLRSAVVAHERAHVQRNDWAVAAIARAVTALFWFHHLAWWALAELRHAAEEAADDVALRSGVRPSDYAQLLVTLARAPVPRGAVAARPSKLARRVTAVLAPRAARPGARALPFAVALVAGVLLAPALAGAALWTTPPHCEPAPADAP